MRPWIWARWGLVICFLPCVLTVSNLNTSTLCPLVCHVASATKPSLLDHGSLHEVKIPGCPTTRSCWVSSTAAACNLLWVDYGTHNSYCMYLDVCVHKSPCNASSLTEIPSTTNAFSPLLPCKAPLYWYLKLSKAWLCEVGVLCGTGRVDVELG